MTPKPATLPSPAAAILGGRVLIVGMGRSGVAAAELCLALEAADVLCTDLRADAERVPGTRARYGGHDRADFLSADLIVVSPGVPASSPDLVAALEAGVPVWGELSLAASVLAEREIPILAITGTNGKSSTTWFTGQLLEAAGRLPFVGGNLGKPLSLFATALVRHRAVEDIAVVEVSSYQLELAQGLHPLAGVILNLTPDHLARHKTMQGYASAKLNLFAAMTASDCAIVPAKDPLIGPDAARRPSGPRVLLLGGKPGSREDEDTLHLQGTRDDGPVPLDRFPLPGPHNRTNIAAAVLLVVAAGVRRDQLDLAAIRPLPHRLEQVHEAAGVRWVNDSKATNVDAALVGVRGIGAGQITLLGGQGKEGADYSQLRPLLEKYARHILCFGASGSEIARALEGLPVELLPTMRAAVARAHALAVAGDTVLLSPATASFDEFRDFEHRGAVFAELAHTPPDPTRSPLPGGPA
jgi:UDP-N-acetylmuramoylalanine--D-glutamate ligase